MVSYKGPVIQVKARWHRDLFALGFFNKEIRGFFIALKGENMKNKVVIIGAGHVGSHCAFSLASDSVAREIVLIDKIKEKASSQAMDIADSVTFLKSVCVRAGDYSDCNDADIVVVSVGKPRLPGQTRLDLLDDSIDMARDVCNNLKKTSFSGIVISITNPADVVADCIRKELEKERWQVFSTGTLLDTARLIRIISTLTNTDRKSINAFSMGEHGDSSMVAFSHITIGGVPFSEFPDISKSHVLERTRGIGMDIINGKGSTEFGIGVALSVMVRAILNDEKRVLPASVLLEGEYGITGVHCGVPCIIGKNGIEKIIELDLSQEENEELSSSCKVIREYINRADKRARI